MLLLECWLFTGWQCWKKIDIFLEKKLKRVVDEACIGPQGAKQSNQLFILPITRGVYLFRLFEVHTALPRTVMTLFKTCRVPYHSRYTLECSSVAVLRSQWSEGIDE